MKGYKVLSFLRHNGQRFTNGDFIEESLINEEDSARLIKMGVISYAVKEEKLVDVVAIQATTVADTLSDEPIEKTLDLNFKLEELKEGADILGLDFPSNITKPKMITLIVEKGHSQYFLDQLED